MAMTNMIVPVLLLLVGLVCLIKGGDRFEEGSTGIAHRFGLRELLYGTTGVSIGTTLPEVMVSDTSAVSGHGEIAYGNAIGSIICNTALISAIPILVRPGMVVPKTLRTPVLFFFGAAALYTAVAYLTGQFTRPVGLILLAAFVVYMLVTVRQMKNDPAPTAPEEEEQPHSLGRDIAGLVVGAAAIAVGANLLVDNGTLIAQMLGVP